MRNPLSLVVIGAVFCVCLFVFFFLKKSTDMC